MTIIHTDHANLTYYRSPQKLTARQTRWVIELMDYDILLKHKPGKAMVPADALSRRYDHSTGIEIPTETTALSDSLFINLTDTELQDAVVEAQESNDLADEV